MSNTTTKIDLSKPITLKREIDYDRLGELYFIFGAKFTAQDTTQEAIHARNNEAFAYMRLFEAAPRMFALLKRIADEGALSDCEPDFVTTADGDIVPGELTNDLNALLKEIEA